MRVASVRVLISIIVALCATGASGEIYKCTSRKSIPKYQNFPCEFDSLGSVPPTTVSDDTHAGIAGVPAPTRAAAPVRRVGGVAHRSNGAQVPRVGMTTDEVRALWGEPVEMNKEELRKGTFDTWTYADSRSVQFDRKGRVTSIRW
jgi:hypothetical protein